jgi:hypothetical protein
MSSRIPSLESWAAVRGLHFTPEGLLPPATDLLAAGFGAGEHRAGLLVTQTKHSWTSVGGFTKRPERFTHNICTGELPGGLSGTLAHHFGLVQGYGDDDGSWTAVPDTVVVARVPEATRVARSLKGVPRVGSVKALISFGRAPESTPAPRPMEGWTWTTGHPREAPQTVAAVLDPETQAALRAAPENTQVELWDGTLCVSVRGMEWDPGRLDALCRAAAALAAALRRVASAQPAGRAGTPVAPPAQPTAPTGEWAGVGEAIAALGGDPDAPAPAPRDERDGGWSGSLLFAPFEIAAGRRRKRRRAAARAQSETQVQGLDAFVAGYAAARGLAVEDRDAFRRAFAAPVPGVPLRAMAGRLGTAGVPGHLALWFDRTDVTSTRYALVAVVAAGPATTVPGYESAVVHGLLWAWEPVAKQDRSAARLDALAATIAGVAAAQPAVA